MDFDGSLDLHQSEGLFSMTSCIPLLFCTISLDTMGSADHSLRDQIFYFDSVSVQNEVEIDEPSDSQQSLGLYQTFTRSSLIQKFSRYRCYDKRIRRPSYQF
jgi:hypothetical protein